MNRLVLADDSVLLRTGLQHLLVAEGFEVVGVAGDAVELLDVTARTSPDGAIIDIRMPPTYTYEGLRAALALRKQRPAMGLLLLSHHLVTGDVVSLLRSGPRGGVGYLLKDRVGAIDSFLADVRRVLAGGTAIDPVVVEKVLNQPRRTAGALEALTGREREILTLMAEGQSNSGISTALFLAERTVEVHVRNIFVKLGLEPQPDVNRRVLAVLSHFRGRAT